MAGVEILPKTAMAGGEILPKEYGYVIIVLVLYCMLILWMSFQVVKAENKDAKLFKSIQREHQDSLENMPLFLMLMILGGIRHPFICASLGTIYIVSRNKVRDAFQAENNDAKLLKSVQRGHQNSLENMPVFFMLMILGGIRHPLICASLGGIYIVSGYDYFTGYSTGDPAKLYTVGKYGFLAIFGLKICTISCAIKFLTS